MNIVLLKALLSYSHGQHLWKTIHYTLIDKIEKSSFQSVSWRVSLQQKVKFMMRKMMRVIVFILNPSTDLNITLHKKLSFQLRISSVNVTKSTDNCGYGHIYWIHFLCSVNTARKLFFITLHPLQVTSTIELFLGII